MTLVRRSLVQRQACTAASNRAELIGVFVEGWLVVNLYAHPHDGPGEAAQLCHDTFIECRLQRSHPWIVCGDFNSLPNDSEISTLCASFGGTYTGLGRPTRWDSSREVDWSCTNYPALVAPVVASDLWISDHMQLSTALEAPLRSPPVGKLRRTPNLRKPPSLPTEEWRRLLKHAWESSSRVKALEAQLLGAPALQAQQVWDAFQLCLQETFLEALRRVPGAEVPRRGALSAKGAVAEVRSESLPCRGPRQEHGSLAKRKVRNRLARLYDFLRCLRAERTSTANTQVSANLAAHRDALGDLDSLQVSNAIASLKADLRRAETQVKARALQDWRARVTQDTAELSKWLKSKTAEHAHCVEDEQGEVSETLPAAAETIASYWQDFWSSLRAHRPPLTERVQALVAGIPLPARLMKGAGGPDGWHAQEDVAAITGEDVYETLHSIFHEYSSRGFLPTLDYTKAFDSLDVEVSLAVLQRHRWPAALLNLLRPVWGCQGRFVQWGHHTRSSPLMGYGQPQRDPLGPLVMTLWLQSGLATVGRNHRTSAALRFTLTIAAWLAPRPVGFTAPGSAGGTLWQGLGRC
ncbi:unnamed protein product [Symbiodinium sp. KB8]|nr:unnamed protein product [Symbiodinium sp. KB8]